MENRLEGRRVAILATEGFEESELLDPKRALEQAGAATEVVAPAPGTIRAWKHDDGGKEVEVDVALDQADADRTMPCSFRAGS